MHYIHFCNVCKNPCIVIISYIDDVTADDYHHLYTVQYIRCVHCTSVWCVYCLHNVG